MIREGSKVTVPYCIVRTLVACLESPRHDGFVLVLSPNRGVVSLWTLVKAFFLLHVL